MLTPQEVKEKIPHTWPLFFARYGRFTPIQQQAIPLILAGHDTLLIAATASGKTEAVIAPLLEKLWHKLHPSASQSAHHPSPIAKLHILYICPTRALVRDLYERLLPIFEDTAITIGMKTGDVHAPGQTPTLLITTPESVDSWLTRSPKSFIGLEAIVLDEIHLFDNTPRGDHLRCLLSRLDWVRQFAHPDLAAAQRVALSATVPDPDGVAQRYLRNGVVVAVPGGRKIVAEITPLHDLSALAAVLGEQTARKSLLFCNSRDEVENTAVFLRQHLAHHAEIFVHYSNLDGTLRREVEERFAQAAVAICVCTSTLELGIDIGTVDDVILLGAPPDMNAFMQRIGRGGRRSRQTKVLCMPKSPGEWARFEAFLTLANAPTLISDPQSYSFRSSVLIQQIFSFIKQSPTGRIRLADVRRIAPLTVSSETIRKIVAQLVFHNYLRPGRMGEWRPDEKLDALLDEHEIYSNIGLDVMGIAAVDVHSGRVLAYTDRHYDVGSVVLFGGQTMQVTWRSRYRFGLVSAPNKEVDALFSFRKSYMAVPFIVTRTVAHSLKFREDEMAVLPQAPGQFLFHFWGTVWGELLAATLVAHGVIAESVNEYCLYMEPAHEQLPDLQEKLLQQAVRDTAVTLANRLQMGRYHKLLPADVALDGVIGQLNLPLFAQKYRAANLLVQPEIQEQLHLLIS